MTLAVGRWGADEARPSLGISQDACPTEIDREALYRQFKPLVDGLVRRHGRTPELRQDLQGEIYFRFCSLVARYDPSRGIPLCAYLSRMLTQSVRNYVRDYWRGESRLVAMQDERQFDDLPGNYAVDACLESLLAGEVRAALPGTIARLPQRQRLVLVWRYYDGQSFEQIAGELGIKPATARSLLRHAITALRKALNQR